MAILAKIAVIVNNMTLPTNISTMQGLFQWANTAVSGYFGIGVSVVAFLILFVGTIIYSQSFEAGLLFAGIVCSFLSIAFVGLGIAPSYLTIVYMGVTALGFLLAVTKGGSKVY